MPDSYVDHSVAVVIIFIPAICYICKNNIVRLKDEISKPIFNKFTIAGISVFFALGLVSHFFHTSTNAISFNNYTMIGLCIYFAVILLITPVIEEIIFRFHIYFVIKDGYGKAIAYLVSNALFVMFHSLNSGDLLNIVLQGIIYTLVYDKTNSIKSSIIIHAFNNCMWFAIVYMSQR